MKGLGIINWRRWESESVEMREFTKLMNQHQWADASYSPKRSMLRLVDEVCSPSRRSGRRPQKDLIWLERPLPAWEDSDDRDIVSPFTDPDSQFQDLDPSSSVIVVLLECALKDKEPITALKGGPIMVEDTYLDGLTITYWKSEDWWIVADPNFANKFVAYLDIYGENLLTDENWKAFKSWKKGA